MHNPKAMSIAEIKKQVVRVEGFNIEINGGPNKKISTNLRKAKQTPGEVPLAGWIESSFPDTPKGEISVLRGNGHKIAKGTLDEVRASYPKDFRAATKQKLKAQLEVANAFAQLAEKNARDRKKTRALKDARRDELNAVAETYRASEKVAALEAIESALRDTNRFHPRVVELCKTAIDQGLEDTQALIGRILKAWSVAEVEKDRLNGELNP